MKKLTFTVCVALVLFCFSAVKAEEPARVLLMGTFHFNNPGLDVIKTKQINVMDEVSQDYLKKLSQHISTFKPTAVMLEFDPTDHAEMNAEYQQYLAGDFTLPVNEMYQIGFRVAKLAGLKQVHSFDERQVHWQGQKLMEHIEQQEQPMMQVLQQKIAEITAETNADHQRLNLQQLLVKNNQIPYDHKNMDFYLLTNAVGAGENFAGADASASWWHRNFRMYARIQQQAKPGARVFAIGGQGHTSILRNLLAIDGRLQEEPILPYLNLKK